MRHDSRTPSSASPDEPVTLIDPATGDPVVVAALPPWAKSARSVVAMGAFLMLGGALWAAVSLVLFVLLTGALGIAPQLTGHAELARVFGPIAIIWPVVTCGPLLAATAIMAPALLVTAVGRARAGHLRPEVQRAPRAASSSGPSSTPQVATDASADSEDWPEALRQLADAVRHAYGQESHTGEWMHGMVALAAATEGYCRALRPESAGSVAGPTTDTVAQRLRARSATLVSRIQDAVERREQDAARSHLAALDAALAALEAELEIEDACRDAHLQSMRHRVNALRRTTG